MSKKRTLSSFGDVSDHKNININSENETDNKTENDSTIKQILEGQKSKEETHVFKGFYLENEVADAIDRITRRSPKGAKSKLVNAILKKHLKDEGYLE